MIERKKKLKLKHGYWSKQTLHEEQKSSETEGLEICDNGTVAFMQETFLKPFLFPPTRSFMASNSRSAKYLLWS